MNVTSFSDSKNNNHNDYDGVMDAFFLRNHATCDVNVLLAALVPTVQLLITSKYLRLMNTVQLLLYRTVATRRRTLPPHCRRRWTALLLCR
jgi:hypothetical protein